MSTPLPIQAESYAQLRDKLADLPMTWYPDLIRTMIEAALEKGAFYPMGASRFAQSVEKEWIKKHRTAVNTCPTCKPR